MQKLTRVHFEFASNRGEGVQAGKDIRSHRLFASSSKASAVSSDGGGSERKVRLSAHDVDSVLIVIEGAYPKFDTEAFQTTISDSFMSQFASFRPRITVRRGEEIPQDQAVTQGKSTVFVTCISVNWSRKTQEKLPDLSDLIKRIVKNAITGHWPKAVVADIHVGVRLMDTHPIHELPHAIASEPAQEEKGVGTLLNIEDIERSQHNYRVHYLEDDGDDEEKFLIIRGGAIVQPIGVVVRQTWAPGKKEQEEKKQGSIQIQLDEQQNDDILSFLHRLVYGSEEVPPKLDLIPADSKSKMSPAGISARVGITITRIDKLDANGTVCNYEWPLPYLRVHYRSVSDGELGSFIIRDYNRIFDDVDRKRRRSERTRKHIESVTTKFENSKFLRKFFERESAYEDRGFSVKMRDESPKSCEVVAVYEGVRDEWRLLWQPAALEDKQ